MAPCRFCNVVFHPLTKQLTSGVSLIVGEFIFGSLMKQIGHTRIQLIASSATLFIFLAALGATTFKPQNYPIAVSRLLFP